MSILPDFVLQDLDTLGIELPESMQTKLVEYLDHLLEINERMNLTAVRERDAAWRRLIVDSLTVLCFLDEIPESANVLDLGSGGGMPGIPVAICRPDLSIHLLEATRKKAQFLQETAQMLSLENVQVINERAEMVGQQDRYRQQMDVVMSRAIGAMPLVLEWSMPLLRVGGLMLAMKGPRVEQELQDCGDALAVLGAGDVNIIEAYPPAFENDLVVVCVTKAEQTPRRYPRPSGEAKKHPIQ